MGRIDIVGLRGEGGAFGHGYVHANPAASSDPILAMRCGRKAGKENGRPRERIGGNFRAIEEGYPLVERGSPQWVHRRTREAGARGRRAVGGPMVYVVVAA